MLLTYGGFLDENMRKVAEEFCMDAEDMLGYVLEYLIDMKKCEKT